MGDGLRRFLHLERPRREGADEPPARGPTRFDCVAGPATSTSTPTRANVSVRPERSAAGAESKGPGGSASGAGSLRERPPASHLLNGGSAPEPPPTPSASRFRDPPRSTGLELDLAPDDEQPFRRCCRCEVDSGRFASACPNCGADLHSDEQRVFNERLWAERRRETADIDRENAERREAARRAEEEGARAQRAAAEALAREVGDRERRRLERDGWGAGGTYGEDDDAWTGRDVRPVGLRLLSLIRDPRWRMGVIAALLALVLGTVVYALARRQPAAIVVVALVVSVLFSPQRPRWRRRFWR
ncbi:MAG: hypothetical protein ACJ79R_18065 [Anaeromyxobacteraceae bacterium]